MTTLVLRQVGYEQRIYWRNRAAAFFTFLFPLLFVVIFGTLNHGETVDSRGGILFDAVLVPGLLAYGVVMATFTSLAIGLARLRDSGVLKRMRGTPLPAWTYLAGIVGSSALVAALLAAVTIGFAALALGVDVRASTLPGLVATLALGTVCFSALGVAMLRLLPSAAAAPAIVNVLVLPLTFVSRVWGPQDDMPAWVQRIASFFPLEHLAAALQYAFDPRTTGSGFSGPDLRSLGVWAAVGSVLMMRALRAEIRRD
jgi:ABC-2 type transport system permease protein